MYFKKLLPQIFSADNSFLLSLCSLDCLFRLLQCFFVTLQNHPLQIFSGGRIDRMCDIPIFSVRCLFARHCNEQSLFSLDHLDIMYDEFIIQCNGYDSLHLSFLRNLANSNVRNLHNFTPFFLLSLYKILADS